LKKKNYELEEEVRELKKQLSSVKIEPETKTETEPTKTENSERQQEEVKE